MMANSWVTSLGGLFWAAVIITFIHNSYSAPFCSQLSGCSCNVTNVCIVCPRGLVQPGFNILRTQQFSTDVDCLDLRKGSSEELNLLGQFQHLIRLEVHRYFIPVASQEALPFNGNANLSYLSLSNNGIQTIADDFFIGLSSLQYLDLSGNQIHKIPPKLFVSLVNLESVFLQNNFIDSLPMELFSNQGRLKQLNLGDNKISYLHHEQFVNVTSLRILDLSHNNLKAVPEEVVVEFSRLQSLLLHKNPWDCSCSVDPLVQMLQTSTSLYVQIEPICKVPLKYKGMALTSLSVSQVNCSLPMIMSVSESMDLLYNAKFTLDCRAEGHPEPAIIWSTPIGDFFGHPSGYHLLDQSDLVKVLSQSDYVFGDHLMKTHVVSKLQGQITVEGMRGALSGNYTCFAVNPAGVDAINITVLVHTGLPVAFAGSLLFCAEVTGGFIVCGCFIGVISYIVNRCRSQSEKKTEEKTTKDDDLEVSESLETNSESTCTGTAHDLDESFDDDNPDPGGSLLMAGDASPGKCQTPTSEEYDRFAAEFPENIKETLEDVRWRLRHGVERKIERVRTHVATIKSSGSQYIDTLRSSSSHAANRVRAGVVMGMEQVKFGVQSIKEFCGTGDMGAQTISTVSVSTDVDTQESTETIKTITFV